MTHEARMTQELCVDIALMTQEPPLTQEVQRNTYDTRNTMTHEGTRGTWIRNLLEALMTQKNTRNTWSTYNICRNYL